VTVIPFPPRLELSRAAPPALATDAFADLVFSLILDREAELAVVRALLRSILSSNVRMPASRLQ
jgi:hypothetical protein